MRTRSNRLVPHVQLYDGSVHPVKSLRLIHFQALFEGFECVGSGNVTGTSAFCQRYPCQDNGTRLCYFRENELTMFRSARGDIFVRAWSSKNVSVYPFPDQTASTCLECRVECHENGVKTHLGLGVTAVEACLGKVCQRLTEPTATELIEFPLELRLHTHEVRVKAWTHGNTVGSFQQECPAIDFCNHVRCWFCVSVLHNPTCAPREAIVIYTVLIYVASVFLLVVLRAMFALGKTIAVLAILLKLIMRVLMTACRILLAVPLWVVRYFRHPQNAARQATSFENFGRIPRVQFLTILCLLVLSPSQSCTHTEVLQGSKDECLINHSGQTTCSFDQTTLLTMSRDQSACLLLKDHVQRPIGTLTLTGHGIRLECQKNSLFFTRTAEFAVQSERRCPGGGSCEEAASCAKVQPFDRLPELPIANRYYGFTGCFSANACWASGCFFCTSSCLLFRKYAYPTTESIYEVFSCPTWTAKFHASIRIEVGNDTVQSELELVPGETETLEQLSVTLVSHSIPPSPVLGE